MNTYCKCEKFVLRMCELWKLWTGIVTLMKQYATFYTISRNTLFLLLLPVHDQKVLYCCIAWPQILVISHRWTRGIHCSSAYIYRRRTASVLFVHDVLRVTHVTVDVQKQECMIIIYKCFIQVNLALGNIKWGWTWKKKNKNLFLFRRTNMVCMCTHDEDVLNAKTVFFVHAVITILPASFLDICKRMRVGVGFSSINTQHKFVIVKYPKMFWLV